MLSDISANCGSSDSIGLGPLYDAPCVGVWDERSELREGGLNGVVGRGGGV